MDVQDLVVAVFVSMHGKLENNLGKVCQPEPTDQSVCVLCSNRVKKELYGYTVYNTIYETV